MTTAVDYPRYEPHFTVYAEHGNPPAEQAVNYNAVTCGLYEGFASGGAVNSGAVNNPRNLPRHYHDNSDDWWRDLFDPSTGPTGG